MTKLLSLRPLLVALVALTAACASAGTVGQPSAERSLRRASDRITAEEIRATNLSNALEVVRRLHPRWLQGRGPDSLSDPGTVVVYLDGVRMGGPEALSNISAISVTSMRFLDAGAATMQWGTGHTQGAIMVSTR